MRRSKAGGAPHLCGRRQEFRGAPGLLFPASYRLASFAVCVTAAGTGLAASVFDTAGNLAPALVNGGEPLG
jgi:hypothetical protein